MQPTYLDGVSAEKKRRDSTCLRDDSLVRFMYAFPLGNPHVECGG